MFLPPPVLPEYGIMVTAKGQLEEPSQLNNDLREGILSGRWTIIEDPISRIPEGKVLLIPCVAPNVPDWPPADAPPELRDRAIVTARILKAAGILDPKKYGGN